MRLHEFPDTFLELIQATAAHIRIPAAHVEKDYWVTREGLSESRRRALDRIKPGFEKSIAD